jgi:hypothetical protein
MDCKFWCWYFLVSRRHRFHFVEVRKHLRYDWSACLISRHMWMTHYLYNSSVWNLTIKKDGRNHCRLRYMWWQENTKFWLVTCWERLWCTQLKYLVSLMQLLQLCRLSRVGRTITKLIWKLYPVGFVYLIRAVSWVIFRHFICNPYLSHARSLHFPWISIPNS